MCIFFIKDGHKYKLTLLQGEILQFIERRAHPINQGD